MFKKHKWVSLILLIAVILALTMIVLSLIPGSRPGRSVLAELFGLRSPAVTVSELAFDVGRNRAFAHSDGCVAAAGTLGIQVLGPDGRETFRESSRFATPVLTENSGRFLAYDIGSYSVRVFTAQRMLLSEEMEAPVISATINKDGWVCVSIQEQSGSSRGTVYVYNDKGRPVYRVSLGSGFVMTAALSDDNSNLAILNIAETGARVTVYRGIDSDKDYADEVFELGSEAFFGLAYLTNTSMLLTGSQSLMVIDFASSGPPRSLYSFEENRLGGYTYTKDFIALHLYDYNIGYSGQVVTLDYSGNVLGSAQLPSDILSIASFGNALMLLSSESLVFYDKKLEDLSVTTGAQAITAGKLTALSEDMALIASDLSATVVRRGD